MTDEIAMSMGFSLESRERLQAALTFELSHNENNGHGSSPPEAADGSHLSPAGLRGGFGGTGAGRAVGASCRGTGAGGGRGCLRHLCWLWEAETSACLRLNHLLAAETDRSRQAERTLREIEAEAGITYARQQRQAVCLAAEQGVLIRSAGTGKTTTVRGIVALFRKWGWRSCWRRPPDGAAKRMSELTGMEAQTVHRLLGMSWNEQTHQVTFQKGEKEPLEADAVIVDEMSMVDLSLFSALLRALRPGTRLVLVGGRGPAALGGGGKRVFRPDPQWADRDGLSAGGVSSGGAVCHHPQCPRGQSGGARPEWTAIRNYFFLCRRDGQRAVSTVVELCRTRLPEKMGIPAEHIQVLTPTRKGPTGTVNLNRLLAKRPQTPKRRRKKSFSGGSGCFGRATGSCRPETTMMWCGARRMARLEPVCSTGRGTYCGNQPLRRVAGSGF